MNEKVTRDDNINECTGPLQRLAKHPRDEKKKRWTADQYEYVSLSVGDG